MLLREHFQETAETEGEEMRKGAVPGPVHPTPSLTLQGAVEHKLYLGVCSVARQGD